MDFWEGFFLGKYWTDSNYEDRPHKLFFLVISSVVCLLSIVSMIFPQQTSKFFLLPFYLHLVLGFALLVGLPFAAAHYHRMNILLRLVILFGYFLQYAFLLISFIQIISGQFTVDANVVSNLFLDLLDGAMYSSSEIFKFLGGLGSTLASVIFGIVIGGILIILLFFIAIFIPLVYIVLFRSLQRFIDKSIHKRINNSSKPRPFFKKQEQ